MSKRNKTADREQLLDEIYAAYLEAVEKGEAPRQENWLARYPEFRKELKEIFDNERVVGRVLPRDTHPPNFGRDYKVLEEIGRGGMGIVYKVHQESLNKTVAIKTIIAGQLATESDVERIRKEARRAARLRHPNIVTVHQVAEHEGQHFFVMEHIAGKSLADLVDKTPLSSTQAADYLKTVAEAIHYAHQRRILHSDLKPANILLDEEGKPHITDFGLAKRLGEDAKYLPSSAVGGTAGYMAPEQVAGEELTTATDVYGLGAVLYALLTGRSPFRAKTVKETLRLVRDESPKPPSDLNPDVDEDLEAICLKCLSKDKDDRYGSADALAEDLVRYQTREETTARLWGRRERIIRWCQRNPLLTASVAGVVTIAILTVLMALSVAQSREEAQLQTALQSNAFAARDVAKTTLLQLQDLSDPVEVAAADAELAALLDRNDRSGLQRYLERLCSDRPSPFASCFVLAADGVIVARTRPEGPNLDDLTEESFNWRDYFQGARKHSGLGGKRLVHISSVYRGRSDDLYKFAISAPILANNDKFLGVICTSMTTDATMGLVILEDPRREVALIGPKDVDSAEFDQGDCDRGYVILFHPAYKRGVDAIEFPDAGQIARKLDRVHARELDSLNALLPPDDDYVDPVGSDLKDYGGRWIAGFAPVGHTGFAVIVQQRFDEALKLDPSVSRNLLWGSVFVSCLAIVIVAVVLWQWALARRVGKSLARDHLWEHQSQVDARRLRNYPQGRFS
ncbi:protein kinase [Acidobacteria bacterium AH-259-L09]|nr:protein kinase [Acidobacteria bacterium AH-259-L09]